MEKQKINVTGRDNAIIIKALATAYAAIGRLPLDCQEVSDRHDMGRLLRHFLGEDWKIKAHQDRSVLSEQEWLGEKYPLSFDHFNDLND